MFCPKCGASNDDSARFCSKCGAALPTATPQPIYAPSAPLPNGPIETYMVHAILVTLFCCIPLGIVAILKASDVSKRQAAGDIAGARAASEEAKNWVLASVILGLIAIVVIVAAGGI